MREITLKILKKGFIMKLFDFFKKRPKVETPKKAEQETPQVEDEGFKESLRAFQLLEEAHADTEYQNKLTQFYDLLSNIREKYSVINSVGSFSDESGDKLIQLCTEAMALELEIKEKREYYENHVFTTSEPCKTLAMIYEKRGEYQRAATICVYAIECGYTLDGTTSGMRGRLARMIKKGNLPLTDELKKILDL